MCKYHDSSKMDWEFQEIPFNCGALGDFRIAISIEGVGRKEPNLSVGFGEARYADDLTIAKIPIKYCPYCGKKLIPTAKKEIQ